MQHLNQSASKIELYFCSLLTIQFYGLSLNRAEALSYNSRKNLNKVRDYDSWIYSKYVLFYVPTYVPITDAPYRKSFFQ